MPKLTALEVRNRKEPGLLGDGNGLFFELTDSGVKRWIYRYKINGKNGKFTIGRYPDLTLEQARKIHQETRDIVKQGKNPAKARQAEKLEVVAQEQAKKNHRSMSFEYIALEWIEQQRGKWSRSHAEAVLTTLKNNVFCSIGDRQIDTIAPPEVLKVLRAVENRGSLEIARKILQRISAVFRYAIQTGKARHNPAAEMQGALKTRAVEHMPAVFDKDLARLLRDIVSISFEK